VVEWWNRNKFLDMPDITMCTGERCPLKQICYRHTAKPSERQSYFGQPPVLGGTCEYFLRAEVRAKTDENDEKSTDKLTK
jgi:hypothetical protein